MEKNYIKNNKGAVTIIEATFVFPIVFFVVFFMIMAGEAYYQRACVEYEVTAAAVRGAARCENPMLGEVLSSGSVPTDPTETDVMPYRYILTSEAKSIATEVAGELEKKLSTQKALLFKNMTPTNVSVTINPKMNLLVSSFPVKCDFDIQLPIRMIFSNEKLKFSYSVSATTSVGDPSEFIRNVSIVKDIVERSEALTNACSSIKNAMDKIGAYTN